MLEFQFGNIDAIVITCVGTDQENTVCMPGAQRLTMTVGGISPMVPLREVTKVKLIWAADDRCYRRGLGHGVVLLCSTKVFHFVK